jgi:hypothetical protein
VADPLFGVQRFAVAGDLPEHHAPPEQPGRPRGQQPTGEWDRFPQSSVDAVDVASQHGPRGLDHREQHERGCDVQADRQRVRPAGRGIRGDRAGSQ